MELIEHILTRNGIPLRYWTGGHPSAPLVAFTHGATIDHHEWDQNLPVVGERFRVMAWDMRGHGLSRPADFDMREAVKDLIAILDELQIEQAILAGHSLGGNLSQEVAFYHPERVRALVCVDCTWNFQKLTAFEAFLVSIAEPMFKAYPYKVLVNQSLALTANSKADQEMLRPAVESHSKAEITQIMLAGSTCLHYEPGYAINKPILMILGDKDQTGNIRKAMPMWAKAEADCQLVIFPNAKHAPNLDYPEKFHDCLMEFLIKRCL